MRVTIDIDDQLLLAAKQLAAETNRTLDQLVEDGLSMLLGICKYPVSPGRFHNPTHQPGGEQPGVDLDNSEALLDLMESED